MTAHELCYFYNDCKMQEAIDAGDRDLVRELMFALDKQIINMLTLVRYAKRKGCADLESLEKYGSCIHDYEYLLKTGRAYLDSGEVNAHKL